ncbi:MAG: hypothetical protein KC777_09725 [Cyanobacteria bacterium HKST-UBA02]|nr:hypothetical protein [Cyanobacteria bacterium HKST-UBA02]
MEIPPLNIKGNTQARGYTGDGGAYNGGDSVHDLVYKPDEVATALLGDTWAPRLEQARYRKGGFSVRDLAREAHESIGSSKLGNVVPDNAREFAGDDVPAGLKCASTASTWLIDMGAMSPRDFKIRVKDMNSYLSSHFGRPQQLNGNFDISKFPQGPIGFISGTDGPGGSNHIAFVERQGDRVYIIHNNNGTVRRQDIHEKFYTSDGRPRYGNMKLFAL